MAKNYDKVIWSEHSKLDLKEIYDFFILHRSQKALFNIEMIISETEKTIFSEQWQKDEYDLNGRRAIIFKKYRVIYKLKSNNIVVVRVYPTKKDPAGIIKD